MVPLIYLVPGLIAVGGFAWEWLRPENDPAWKDNNVFNDRMRQIHAAMLDLNNALGSCKRFVSDKQQLTAWRAFRTNFSRWYGDTGSLYLAPNDAEISNAKLYTTQLAKWIDLLKQYPECHGTAVTAPKDERPTPPGGDKFAWITPVAYVAGGWLLYRFLTDLIGLHRKS